MNIAVHRPLLVTDEEFERMVSRGLSSVLGPVELRDGTLCRMNAQHAPHLEAKMAVYTSLAAALKPASGLVAAVEATIRYGGGFAPLPDIFVWRRIKTSGPIPGDRVLLVVEIADTTLADDLGPKRASYAAAGLAEYWVVDLGARALHQFSDPREGAFTRAATHAEGARIDCAAIAASIVFRLPD